MVCVLDWHGAGPGFKPAGDNFYFHFIFVPGTLKRSSARKGLIKTFRPLISIHYYVHVLSHRYG